MATLFAHRHENPRSAFSSLSSFGGRTYHEGVGSPTSATSWTTNLANIQGFPAIAIRVVFEADVDAPKSLPFIDGLSFTFSL